MKGMKKLLSILMVLTLVLSLGATAFASGDLDMTPQEGRDAKQVVVTLPAEYKTHTMVAYQIFTGAQKAGDDGSEQNQLGVTGWADGVDFANLLGALAEKYPDNFKTDMNAAAAAKAINDLNLSGTAAYEFATIVAKHVSGDGVTFNKSGEKPTATLGSGYWIIIDKTEDVEDKTGFAYSAYLLQVVGDEGQIPVTPKFDVPTVDKQVGDQNDSEVGQMTWGEVADWDMGDKVPFKITATMPSTLEGYTSYKLVFHDTMSKGLTLDQNSITLKVGEKTIDRQNYNITTGTIGTGEKAVTTITITIADALAETIGATAGSVITVEYEATLDKTTNGVPRYGIPNEVYLEYSNNPNGEGAGTTTKDKVVVFYFSLGVEKVQPDGQGGTKALDGAGFTLYKHDADAEGEDKWVQVGEEVMVEVNADARYVASFNGLDQGRYKLVESTVPAGYNKADDIEFTVEATYNDETGENTTVKSLTIKDSAGNVISGANDDEGKPFTAGQGSIRTTVLNSSGLELPETGGIGTTIFYVAGAVLAAAALVLLVTKRRVNGAEK